MVIPGALRAPRATPCGRPSCRLTCLFSPALPMPAREIEPANDDGGDEQPLQGARAGIGRAGEKRQVRRHDGLPHGVARGALRAPGITMSHRIDQETVETPKPFHAVFPSGEAAWPANGSRRRASWA